MFYSKTTKFSHCFFKNHLALGMGFGAKKGGGGGFAGFSVVTHRE